MEPLVSIIIPTFNSRQWLGEAVDSALGQSYTNCEVLVVDDGSTDGTGQWLRTEYGERIKYLNKLNGGLGSARNMGLEHARGEYVQFLDSDDFIAPKKVATHVEFLKARPEVDVVYCHTLCFQDGEFDKPYDWPRADRYCNGYIFSRMLYMGFLLIHAPLSRMQSVRNVGGFDRTAPSRFVDWDFWLRVAWSGAKFFYLSGPAMCYYRVRRGQMSSGDPEVAYSGLQVLAKVDSYVQDPQERKQLRLYQARGHWRFRYGRSLAEAGQVLKGLCQMARGVLADRSELDYKISFMTLTLLIGPRKAAGVQIALKRAKAWFVGASIEECIKNC